MQICKYMNTYKHIQIYKYKYILVQTFIDNLTNVEESYESYQTEHTGKCFIA